MNVLSDPAVTARSASPILDDLLRYSCEALQLTPTLHAAAEQHYHAVADWLGAEDSFFYEFDPDIYPQGSFRIGTTTKPIGRNEYDLDFVLQLALSLPADAMRILDELYARLLAHKTYATMAVRLKRCVRLKYAGEFHMDILAAIPERSSGTRILVPDRKVEDWKSSDPKGYASWFEQQARHTRLDKAAQVTPLPAIQTAEQKTVLQRIVQLAKRCRDKFPSFAQDGDLSPRSIVLTTLAAQAYSGQLSTSLAIHETINTIRERVARSASPFEVWNPVNEKELLSEQWETNPGAYREFGRWLDWFATALEKVTRAGTIPEMQRQLGTLFGDDIATNAIRKHAAHMDELRNATALKVSSAGVLATTGRAAATVRPNTFYGDDD